MKRISLFLLVCILVITGCNISMMQRKYRPGIGFARHTMPQNPRGVKITEDRHEGNKLSSADPHPETEHLSRPELQELKTGEMQEQVLIVCDTPPKKDVSEPWSLYKEKQPKGMSDKGWKPIEPVNLAAFLVILATIILGIFFPYVALLFIGFGIVLILSIISLCRIKKHPHSYSNFSRAFDLVFIWLGIALASILLIVLIIIAAPA